MKRLTCLAIATLLIGTTWTATAEARPRPRNVYCHYQTADGRRGWSNHDVRLLIRCATNKFGVAFSTAYDIARRESGLDEGAVNRYSGTSGIYQHVRSYWPSRRATYLNIHPYWTLAPSVFNARANVMVSVDMMRRCGFGPWAL